MRTTFLMLPGGRSQFGIGWDLAVQVAALALLVAIAARLFPRVLA